MNPNRNSGVLLPIFSLPGDFGIGDFGKGAYQFIDLLKKCGFHYKKKKQKKTKTESA